MKSQRKGNFIKSWGLLMVALVVSGLAFWLAINYLTAKEGSLRDEILNEITEKANIIVAASDLMPGDIISLDTMALAEVDKSNLSTFALSPENFAEIEGYVIAYPMSAGEPLLSHAIVGEGIERFSDLLDNDERAITLEIDSLNSAAGMLVAGDFVDLMFLMENSGSDENDGATNLRPLLQNVRILAIDNLPLRAKEQEFVNPYNQDSAMQYSNVTVGVEFEDASKLILARDIGDIIFMLRNKNDDGLHDAELITHLDLNTSVKTERSYQFFSSQSGGEVTAKIRKIVPSIDLDISRRLSMPISSPIAVLNTDNTKLKESDKTVKQ
jgi:pilus assembly protein CpaB